MQICETAKTVFSIVSFVALVGVEMVLQRVTGRVWFGHGGIIEWRRN